MRGMRVVTGDFVEKFSDPLSASNPRGGRGTNR